MALAFDAVGPSSLGKPVSFSASTTWSHTTSGTQRILFVAVGCNSAPTSIAVTYNGVSMTLVSVINAGGASFNGSLSVFALINPATGTNTVSVTPSSTTDMVCGSVSYNGADQTTGFTNLTTNTGTSSGTGVVTGTLTGIAAGDFGLAFGVAANAMVNNTGTVIWNCNLNTGQTAGQGTADYTTSSGTQTINWSQAVSGTWGWIGIEVIAASGGGAAPSTPVNQPGGRVWRNKFRKHQQTMASAPSATALNANGGLATGTGAAGNPVAGVAPDAALATAAGAAGSPGVSIAVQAGLATASGTSQSPTTSDSTPAGLATSSGAAGSPAVAFVVNAGLATAAGGAQNATASSATSIPAGLATATGAAGAPGVGNRAPGLASGTGAAGTPVAARTAGLASGTGAAGGPTVAFVVKAGLATASGTSQAPGIAGDAIGLASGTGAAGSPKVAFVVNAGLATASGGAQQASATTPRRNVDYTGSTLAVAKLGGTLAVTPNTLGGTLSVNALGGTLAVTPNVLGGTLSVKTLGGTLTVNNTALTGTLSVAANTLGGTAVEDKMQEIDIVLNEFNDATVTFQILNNGSPDNITGMTVNALFKQTRGDSDTAPTTTEFSSAGGSPAITINTPSTGSCTLAIPDADVLAGAWSFYRIDVVNGTITTTAIFGTVTITPL